MAALTELQRIRAAERGGPLFPAPQQPTTTMILTRESILDALTEEAPSLILHHIEYIDGMTEINYTVQGHEGLLFVNHHLPSSEGGGGYTIRNNRSEKLIDKTYGTLQALEPGLKDVIGQIEMGAIYPDGNSTLIKDKDIYVDAGFAIHYNATISISLVRLCADHLGMKPHEFLDMASSQQRRLIERAMKDDPYLFHESALKAAENEDPQLTGIESIEVIK